MHVRPLDLCYIQGPPPNTFPDTEALTKDYLAHNALLFREEFAPSSELARRVSDALTIFESFETKAKEFVRSAKVDIE